MGGCLACVFVCAFLCLCLCLFLCLCVWDLRVLANVCVLDRLFVRSFACLVGWLPVRLHVYALLSIVMPLFVCFLT